jgi:hypothetical protein
MWLHPDDCPMELENRQSRWNGTANRRQQQRIPDRANGDNARREDGRRYSWTSRTTTWQVGLVSLANGKITILRDNGWRDTYVGNFSPDGRWLAYFVQVSKNESAEGAVYTVATDGSANTCLSPRTP